MPKEYCPYCAPLTTQTVSQVKEVYDKCVEPLNVATAAQEKRSSTIMSLDELYHVAQSLESQAQRLRTCFGLVIATQPPSPTVGQLTGARPADCELVGRLEEIGRCLRRTIALHEETIELRRV